MKRADLKSKQLIQQITGQTVVPEQLTTHIQPGTVGARLILTPRETPMCEHKRLRLSFQSPAAVAPLDIRSDIYSLGCTLWFLLIGEAPFTGSLARVIAQQLTADPPFELIAHLPVEVQDLLRRMLAKNPATRPQTPIALHAEICACREALGRVAPSEVALPWWRHLNRQFLKKWPRGPALAWGMGSVLLLATFCVFEVTRGPLPKNEGPMMSRATEKRVAVLTAEAPLPAPVTTAPEITEPVVESPAPTLSPAIVNSASVPSVVLFFPTIFSLESEPEPDLPLDLLSGDPVSLTFSRNGVSAPLVIPPKKIVASRTFTHKRRGNDPPALLPSPVEKARRSIHRFVQRIF